MSPRKSRRPTSLDVDEAQGTNSSVGLFSHFDQSRTRVFEYSEAVTNASPQADETETTVPDYPRPAAPAEEATQQHQQEVHRNEEEPKKDKKYIVQESSYWKTRPTRVLNERNKGHIGTRIGQPAGKAFGA